MISVKDAMVSAANKCISAGESPLKYLTASGKKTHEQHRHRSQQKNRREQQRLVHPPLAEQPARYYLPPREQFPEHSPPTTISPTSM